MKMLVFAVQFSRGVRRPVAGNGVDGSSESSNRTAAVAYGRWRQPDAELRRTAGPTVEGGRTWRSLKAG